MPESVLIKHDRCRLTLALPIYFEKQSLDKISKMFKLLGDRAWQNEADWDADGISAWETLDQFFPAWERELKDRLGRTKTELITAKQDAESKRRIVAALGSTVDGKNARHPKTDHQKAIKKVKRLERAAKQAKAAVERGDKIINIYNQIMAKKAR